MNLLSRMHHFLPFIIQIFPVPFLILYKSAACGLVTLNAVHANRKRMGEECGAFFQAPSTALCYR